MSSTLDFITKVAITSRHNRSMGLSKSKSVKRVKKFIQSINKEKEEIRIFVQGSLNLGHQSSSIGIMYRLISLGAKKFRIVYEPSQYAHGFPEVLKISAEEKFPKLIQGLTIDQIKKDKRYIIEGASPEEDVEILFTEFERKGHSFLHETFLGITGGFDGPVNLTEDLKVQCFLVLQPYMYEKHFAQNIIYFRSNEEYTFTHRIPKRGYYVEDPISLPTKAKPKTPKELTLAFGDFFSGSPLSWKAFITKSIATLVSKGKVHLCPMYFSPGRASSSAATIFFNLISGWTCYDKQNPSLPLVILSIGDFPSDIFKVISLIGGYEELVHNQESPEDRGLIDTILAWSPFLKREELIPYLREQGYFEAIQRICLITQKQDLDDFYPHLYQTIDSEIVSKHSGEDNKSVFIVDLGRVPRNVFHSLFKLGTVSSIFEGEGSASQMFNLGKPYINLQSREVGMNDLGGKDYKMLPTPKLRDGIAPIPIPELIKKSPTYFTNERWNRSVHKRPDRKLASFFSETVSLKSGEQTEVSSYFQELREYFHDPFNDKLFQALIRMTHKLRKLFPDRFPSERDK